MRTLGEVQEDGVGLWEVAAVVELEHRDAALHVLLLELRRLTLLLQDVDGDDLTRDLQLCESEPDLVAVARDGGVIEAHVRWRLTPHELRRQIPVPRVRAASLVFWPC